MAIYHTQTEGRVFDIINQSVEAQGFEIVRIKNFHLGKVKTLQIMIDKANGENISIEDCEQVSKHISKLLDVEEAIDTKYALEISSAGLNRPLTRKKDFEQNQGNIIKFILFTPLDNKRRFIGKINKIEDDKITIIEKDNENLLTFELDNIEEAFLQYFDSNIKFNAKQKRL